MTSPLFPPTTPDGWDALIDNPYNIGPFPRATQSEDWWVVAGMHVRLPEALAGRPASATKLLVFADTITLTTPGTIDLGLDALSDVVLIADTLQTNGYSNASRRALRRDETFRMTVFCRNLPDFYGLLVRMEGKVANNRFYRGDGMRWSDIFAVRPDQYEFYFNAERDLFTVRRLPMPYSGPGFDGCVAFLSRLLLTAQSFIDQRRPDAAARVLDRLEHLIALNPRVASWQLVGAQAAATRELLEPRWPISDRVPSLDPEVYNSMVQSYAEALRTFAGAFDTFINRSNDLSHRRESAQLMLREQGNALRFQALVVEQLEDNLEDATANLNRAQASLEAQTRRVEAAEAFFQEGVDAWRDEQQRAANWAIAGAVFSAVFAIGATLAGKPSGIPTAIAAAARAGEVTVRMVQMMQRLIKLIQMIQRLVQMVSEITAAQGRRGGAAGLAGRLLRMRTEADPQDLNGAPSESAYWEQFCVEVEAALAPAVTAGIPGAEAYLQQMRILIIYGRALTSAQAALPPIVQELAQAHLLREIAKEQGDAVARQIGRLEASSPPATLAVSLWLRHRAVQRAMFTALQDFDAAHRYWALSTVRLQRDPSGGMNEMLSHLLAIADMQASVQRALASFTPSPQDFTHIEFKVPEEAVQDFRENGTFALRFDPDFGPLAEWGDVGRVRVQEVAVWIVWKNLEGQAAMPPRLLDFTIRTDGDYYDQRVEAGRILQFHFLGPRVNRMFQYNPQRALKDPQGAISVRARVAQDFRARYSEPTLFTGWQISLARDRRGEMNHVMLAALRDHVAGIKLEFSGTFIMDKNRI